MIDWGIEKTLREMSKVARCDESCHALSDGTHDWERRCPPCASGDWDRACDTCWISSRVAGWGIRERLEKAGFHAYEATQLRDAAEAERDDLLAEVEQLRNDLDALLLRQGRDGARKPARKAAIEAILRAGVRYGYDLGWMSECPEVVVTWDGDAPKFRLPNPTTDPAPS